MDDTEFDLQEWNETLGDDGFHHPRGHWRRAAPTSSTAILEVATASGTLGPGADSRPRTRIKRGGGRGV